MNSVAKLLDELSEDKAAEALAMCCGSTRWVRAMMEARPFGDDHTLFDTAERTWWNLDAEDWLEAFSHHPKIGGPIPEGDGAAGARSWAAGEQAGMAGASPDVAEAMAARNIEYEERFGYVFLLCATGRSGAEMLAALTSRLHNDPAAELEVAAGEQARITRLRLEKLVNA